MKRFRPIHMIYGGLRIIKVCRDWPKWFQEYVNDISDGSDDCYRMRAGIELHTRHNLSDFHMIDEIWAYRKYDYFGYRVAPGDIVVDIGANIGTFSVYASKACGASRVLSFEPYPDNYRLLSKNAEQNELRNITCVNRAVSGNQGRRTLGIDPVDCGSHSLVMGSFSRTVDVECITLGDIFDQFALEKIDYLKMDCEGSEYEILENAKSSLDKIRRISMETHTIPGRNAHHLKKLLSEYGFGVRLFGDSRLYATRLS
jgi:FkbM family methyltransferase